MLCYYASPFVFSPEDSSERDLANQLSVHCRSAHYNKTESHFLGQTRMNALCSMY